MSEANTSVSCVGIIMDGNRRWAKAKGVPTLQGHTAGFAKAKEVVKHAFEQGVETVIVYAFSTENWNRATEEVGYLMDMFAHALTDEFSEIVENGIEIKFLGDLSRLPANLHAAAKKLAEDSKKNAKGKTFVVALSYGGRAEIVAAINKLLAADKKEVSEEDVSAALWSAGTPDPDLVIRTGGVQRLSNFLPWQSVYSELFFSDTLWPDFSKEEFDMILADFRTRERRKGK